MEYEEIKITNYIKLIRRKKRMIFGVFLIVFIATIVYTFFISPKVYKIDTLIEMGTIGGVLIEETAQVAEKINSDVYGIFVRNKLEISEAAYPNIKTKNLKGTDLLLMEIESDKPEPAIKVLREINNLILNDHLEKTKNKKELIEKNIERLRNKIALLGEEKKNLEEKEKTLEEFSPYQRLTEQLRGSLFALFDIREKLSVKGQEVEGLYMQINSLRGALEDFQPTMVLKAPTASENTIKPRPLLNIVIAPVLGVFLGVFLALGKEWWERNKND